MALAVFPHDHISPAGAGRQRVIIKLQHPRQLAEDVRRTDAMLDINVNEVWRRIGTASSFTTWLARRRKVNRRAWRGLFDDLS
jgi:hypothetical protein